MKIVLKYSAFVLAAIFALSISFAQAPLKKPSLSDKEHTPKQSYGINKSDGKISSSKVSPADGSINGYGYVDLGLPSGLKWATCNVGAKSPEEYGDYYAWGETTTKSSFTKTNSKWSSLSESELKKKGVIDSNVTLTSKYDAATVNCGAKWRMPTLNEIKELIENTTFIWTTVNSVKGRLLKSKSNGKTIFLPACGKHDEYESNGINRYGGYWSNMLDESDTQTASGLFFDSSEFDCYYCSDKLYRGLPIRGVIKL